MPRSVQLLGVLLTTCAALFGCSGCGGSADVVRIEGKPGATISRPTLDHWMQALAGSDFRTAIGTEGPRGLVSDPPDYDRCVIAEKLVAVRSFFNQLRPHEASLMHRCRVLHSAVKRQALSFLIAAQWTILEGAKRGVTVTDADVRREFANLRNRRYPTEASLRTYLSERQWSLADLVFQLKLELTAAKLEQQQPPSATIVEDGQQATTALLSQHNAGMIARTNCKLEYVVPGCRQQHGQPPASLTPDAILEALIRSPI